MPYRSAYPSILATLLMSRPRGRFSENPAYGKKKKLNKLSPVRCQVSHVTCHLPHITPLGLFHSGGGGGGL